MKFSILFITKVIYGESDFRVYHFNTHVQSFKNGIHECAKLQEVSNNAQDKSSIRFIILEAGPAWDSKQKRLEREHQFIQENSDRS